MISCMGYIMNRMMSFINVDGKVPTGHVDIVAAHLYSVWLQKGTTNSVDVYLSR